MRKVLCLLSIAVALFASCKPEEKKESIGDYLGAIAVSNVEDNALRVNVSIDFKKACDFSVSYWAEDDRSDVMTTKVRQSQVGRQDVTLLFLYPETTYHFTVNIDPAEDIVSGIYDFSTFSLPADMPKFTVEESTGADIPGYIFQTMISKAGYIMIADTDGKIIWYQAVDAATRMFDLQLEQGKIWLLTGFKEGSTGAFQRLCAGIRCLDLYGNEIHRWSIADGEIDIPYAHHEIRQMPDGNIVVVTNFTRTVDLSSIGGAADALVYADGYTIFNEEGKVLKTWDAFEELGDLTTCPYVQPLKRASDLMHGNSFNWDSEGNYYMTFNHSSQLWKIDPVSGKVLYRVGPDGNVAMDESGYGNGLHNAIPLAPDKVLCMDNGRERGWSRAIIYKVDPQNMTVTVELSVPLDVKYYSTDRSGVQLILNDTVLMFGMTVSQYVVFTDLKGNVLKSIKRTGMTYRTGYIEKLPEY